MENPEYLHYTVYKAFRRNENYDLVSVVMDRKARVTYYEDETATAPEWLAEKGHHLTAFDEIWSAIEFAANAFIADDVEIWSCSASNPVSLPVFCKLPMLDDGEFEPVTKQDHSWPDGTVMFKYIKPIAPRITVHAQ